MKNRLKVFKKEKKKSSSEGVDWTKLPSVRQIYLLPVKSVGHDESTTSLWPAARVGGV